MSNLTNSPVFLTMTQPIPRPPQKALYEASKLQWMASHGYSVALLLTEFHKFLLDADPNFERPVNELIDEWENDQGFDGSIWPCWQEWLDTQHTHFFALMEERGWKITKETTTENYDYYITLDWQTPQGLICHIDVSAGYEMEDLRKISKTYVPDNWARHYILKCANTEGIKLPPLVDILDASNNIKVELEMAVRQLEKEGVK